MKNRLVFFNKKQKSYQDFHKKYKFSQNQIAIILHKLRYNMPQIFSNKPNLDILQNLGLNPRLPIYVENIQNLDFCDIKNLYLTQKIFDFNLIIFYKDISQIKAIKSYPINAKFLSAFDTDKTTKETLFLLNINTKKIDAFRIPKSQKIEFYGSKIYSKQIVDFALVSGFKNNKNNIILKEYFSSGNFYFLNNLIKNNKKTHFFFKKTLFFDFLQYFLIKKIKNGYFFENLTTNKKYYFLSNSLIKTFKINKTKNTQNIQITAEFYADFSKEICIYFGQNNIKIHDQNLRQKIKLLSQSIFNFKICSNDKKLDFLINKILPDLALKNMLEKNKKFSDLQKINLQSIRQIVYFYKCKKIAPEEAYFAIKNLLFIQKQNVIFFKKTDLENYNLEITFNGQKKNVFVANDLQKKVVIDGVDYYNCSWITSEVFGKYSLFQIWV